MARRSFLFRAVRTIVVLTTTAAVLAGAGYAVQTGAAFLSARAAATPPPEAAPPVPVTVRPLTQDTGYAVARSFVGQVEPRKTVALSFELGGRLDGVLVDEGDHISQGQVIATQDTELLRADRTRQEAARKAVEAQLAFALQTLERSEALRDRGFASQERLDQAMATRDELDARISEINAALTSIDIQLQKAQLYAPFNGRVTRRILDGGEAVGAGQTLLEVIETGGPQVRVGVPLSVPEAALQEAEIVVGGRVFPATLASFRPDIDPVTRTRTALYDIAADAPVTFGQTARLNLQTQIESVGTWVPLRSLKEGDKGQWTLLVVDAENVVRQASVLVIHATTDQAYVQGTFPPGTRMIEEGPQRVILGQTVRITDTL